MREIKFRAWDHKDARMKYAFWIEASGYHLREDDISGFPRMNENDYTLMQYTGLKDKNGVEIYERDVIRARHEDGGIDTGSVVYGSKGAFCLYLPNVGTGIKSPLLNYIEGMMFPEYDFEVIGNIYENPELLKETS